VVRLELDGHVSRHPVDRSLAHTEDDPVRVGHPGIPGDGDDQPGSLADHGLRGVSGSDEVRADANLDHVPIRRRPLPERTRLRQVLRQRECVVDQDVESAMLPLYPVEQCRRLLVVAVVDLDGNSVAAPAGDFRRRFGYRAGQRVRARGDRAPGDVNGETFRTESQSYPLADPAAGTGNHCDFALQSGHPRSPKKVSL
jgi:hypothetical protein